MIRISPTTISLAVVVAVGCGKKPVPPAVTATAPPGEPTVELAGGLPSRVVDAPTPVTNPPATFAEAEAAVRAGRLDEARSFLLSYTTANPTNAAGFHLLGVTLWKRGDFGPADRALEKALELDQADPKIHFNSARVLLSLGRDHEAFERAETGLLLDSTSVEGLRLLARAHAKLGNIDGALENYRRAVVINDRDVWTLNNLGVLYLEQGNPEAALGPLARAVLLQPNAPIFRNNLGQALERVGRPVSAKRAYQAAVNADSTYQKARANLDRLLPAVSDTLPSDGVEIGDLAETFRLLIEMWKDRYPRPAVDSVAVPDTLPHTAPPSRR